MSPAAEGGSREVEALRRQLLELQSRMQSSAPAGAPRRIEAVPLIGRGAVGQSLVLLPLLGLAGLVSILLGWHGAANAADPSRALPYLVSGGLTGVAMVGTACGLMWIQSRRRLEAYERRQTVQVAEALARLRDGTAGR